MAIVSTHSRGGVGASAMTSPWHSGECICMEIGATTGYLTASEALILYALLGAALEAVGCPLVEIAVGDESEEASE